MDLNLIIKNKRKLSNNDVKTFCLNHEWEGFKYTGKVVENNLLATLELQNYNNSKKKYKKLCNNLMK